MTSNKVEHLPDIKTTKAPLSQEQKQQLLKNQDWYQEYHVPTYNYGDDDDDVSIPTNIPNPKFGNLLIVSNRLPITISKDEQTGGFQYKKSSGGLVTALTGMTGREFKWIGWTGGEVTNEEDRGVMTNDLAKQYNCVPVFLNDKDADDYYNGFSNGILWPLFHYLFEKNSVFNEKHWQAYQKVNQQFADVIVQNYQDGDMVWVHDYHLMLLPLLLRRKIPEANIAFFLHIPFPSSEIYRILPVRNQLLEGLLACNFIAFHTYNFARHFLSACTRTLGIDTSPKGFVHNGVFVSTKAFPIGIDPTQFQKGIQSKECQDRIKYFLDKFKGKKIIVGVDRLDYTKGVDSKFLAYEKFLQTYPKYKESTVLIQVGVPTRQDVQEYKELVCTVNELVGRINSTFGTLDGFPVHYINKSVPFPDLCALYAIADALIVTSIRDGMNLVSSEFVVCQDESQKLGLYQKDVGVLILSEFAGAATSLGGSIIINPYDIEQTAKAMFDSLEMGHTERQARHDQNFRIVSTNTATYWGESFMHEFEKSCRVQYASTFFHRSLTNMESAYDHPLIRQSYVSASDRLFLLDYDGTCVDLHKYPTLAIPTKRLEAVLERLCADTRNQVYLMTGRDRETMIKYLGHIRNLGIACEHGMRVRHPGKEEWTSLYKFDEVDLTWMKYVRPILEQIAARTPGSFPEIKESSLVFHYRNSDPEYGNWQANELKLHLEESFNSAPMDIIKGKKVIEIRPANVGKGIAARRLIRMSGADFVLCAGDDNTDEEMFEEAEKFSGLLSGVHHSSPGTPTSQVRKQTSVQDFQALQQSKHIFTVVVGAQHANYSRAHYAVASPTDMLNKLELLAAEQEAQ